MADSKNTSSETVVEPVDEKPVEPTVEVKKQGVKDLYFFPDIQKSVEATSHEEAKNLVQPDLDAYEKKQKEGNK